MSSRTIRRLCFFLMICFGMTPALSLAAEQECNSYGQREVTPAVVTGAPQQHLRMRTYYSEDDINQDSTSLSGYLITGDEVDLVDTCAGEALVRFHGPKRISVGWVDESRIRVAGSSHSTLPQNAAQLCRAAQDTLNRGKALALPPSIKMGETLGDAVVKRLNLESERVEDAYRIVVDGRPMVAVVVNSGGTAYSLTVYVLSGDLRTRLSPADRDGRDVLNDGHLWSLGVMEDVVLIGGQPMVRSRRGSDKEGVYLSLIGRDGDIIPTCAVTPRLLKKPKIKWSANDRVCHALVAGQQQPVPIHPPAAGETLAFQVVPEGYQRNKLTRSEDADAGFQTLNFHNNGRASDVQYTLRRTGIVDVDNSGTPSRVGLVSFHDGNSTAGDGSYEDMAIFPVYLDNHGTAQLSAPANKALADALPHGMSDGRLVTVDGATYLELTAHNQEHPSEVWKITPGGAHPVCQFKLTGVVVAPLSS